MAAPETIHITRWGDTGPVVVLVHGSAQGSRVGGNRHFVAQQALAEQGWRLVVPDRPGHGASADPGRPDDAQIDGAWVADLLGDGAHLVGHSFGGCVALAAAARRPGAVRSLTLVEPGMHKLATDDPQVRRFVIKLAATMLFSLSAERRARRFAELVGIPKNIRGGADRAEMRAMGRGIARLKLPSAATMRSELAIVKNAGIPLLVITGGWSPAFDIVGARAAALGGGEHRIIAAPNHFPNLMPGFNDQLMAFMQSADARRQALAGLLPQSSQPARGSVAAIFRRHDDRRARGKRWCPPPAPPRR